MFAMREHLARIMPTKISARKTPYKVMALILTHRGGRAQALRRANSLLAVLLIGFSMSATVLPPTTAQVWYSFIWCSGEVFNDPKAIFRRRFIGNTASD